MKVLFLARAGNESPWLEDFRASLGDAYDVVLWSAQRPFAEQVEGAVAIADLGAPLNQEMFAAARAAGISLWQIIGAGSDHIDRAWVTPEGFPIANIPGPQSARALAEHALMLMLTIARRFALTQEHLAEGRFYRAFGDELGGKTLGIVGLGASGSALARVAAALGMEVIAVAQSPAKRSLADELGIEFVGGGAAALDELLGRSDYVSIHVPLTPATQGMFDAGRLAAMKTTGVLINVARGKVVDQEALLTALRDGTIRAAGLDVFEVEPIDPADPLLQLPNVVATPHVAGSTHETSVRRGAVAAENVRRVVAGEAPQHTVMVGATASGR